MYTVFNKCILRPPLYYNTAKYVIVHLVCWIFMYNFRGRGLNRQIYQAAPILPLQFTILYCIRHHSFILNVGPQAASSPFACSFICMCLYHLFVFICLYHLFLFVCIIYNCLFVFVFVFYIKLICFPPCRSAAPLFCETNLSVWDCSQQSCSTDKCSYCICSH